jgi:hypothetical protein
VLRVSQNEHEGVIRDEHAERAYRAHAARFVLAMGQMVKVPRLLNEVRRQCGAERDQLACR